MNEVQKDKTAEVVKFANQDDILKAFDTDPALRDEFLEAESKGLVKDFIAKYTDVAPEKTDDSDKANPSQEEKPKEATPDKVDDEEVEFKVKKSRLGTYIKNTEKPEEAIEKLIRGKEEADTFIDFTKKVKIPQLTAENEKLKSDVASLKKEFDLYKSKKDLTPQEEVKFSELKNIELPTEDEFTLEPAKAIEKFKTAFDTVQSVIKDRDLLVKMVKETKEQVTNLSTKFTQKEEEDIQTNAKREQQNYAAREFSEIDTLVSSKQFKETFGETQRSVKQIQDDYLEFVRDFASLNGVKEPLVNGKIIPEVLTILGDYLNEGSPNNAKLKEAADKNGIKLPEDYPILQTVYEIRDVKSKHPTLDYTDASLLYLQHKNPNMLREAKVEGAKEAFAAKARALANRQGHAKETPPGEGGNASQAMSDAEKINFVHETARAISNGTATHEDITQFRNILDTAGMSKVEIDMLCAKPD